MKKNYRPQYLKFWLEYLKGKNEIDTKTLALFLEKKLKGGYSTPTLKRYNATVIANLYGNGYIEGKKGKTFVGAILPIVKEITRPVLDKCLTRDFGKVHFTENDLRVPSETPASVKKAEKPTSKKKVRAKRKAGAEKEADVEKKEVRKIAKRKPGPAKKTELKKSVRKGSEQLPVPKGRKKDLLDMGRSSFLYVQQLNQRVEELEGQIAGYERIFENLRQLFSQEMDEMEEWILKVLQ
jgi:hypothetical protein